MALALAVPCVANAADQPGPPDTPSAYTSEKVSYDEVGYAGPGGGEGVSASHATLEAGSFAEVTDLDSGRTILVRITGGAPANRIAGLSGAALAQLGAEGRDTIPIRIRRTNPPEFERAALAQGQSAKERLATPPALLNALRKKLSGQPAPKVAAAAPPAAAKPAKAAPPPKKIVTRPLITPAPVPPKPAPAPSPAKPAPPKPAPGVDFDTTAKAPPPPAPPAPPPPPRDTSRPHWDEKVMSEGGDEFIVEQAEEAAKTVGQRPAKPIAANPRPAAPVRPAPAPAANGGWYVQIGAFSSAANARAAATRVGGGIAQSGNIYRVRTGPYASEAAARAALGGLAAKGYRGARVTR